MKNKFVGGPYLKIEIVERTENYICLKVIEQKYRNIGFYKSEEILDNKISAYDSRLFESTSGIRIVSGESPYYGDSYFFVWGFSPGFDDRLVKIYNCNWSKVLCAILEYNIARREIEMLYDY